MKVHSLYIFYIDASTTGKCKHSELLYLSTLHWVLCCLPDRVGSLSRTQHKYRVKHISRSTTIVDIHLTRLQTKKKCKSICLRLTIRILWSVVCFPCARTYPTPNRPVDSPPFLYPKCQSVTPTITHVLNPTPSRWRCKQRERTLEHAPNSLFHSNGIHKDRSPQWSIDVMNGYLHGISTASIETHRELNESSLWIGIC